MKRSAVVLCVLLLALLTVWVYRPVGSHGFMAMDDPEYVAENRHVQRGLTADSVSWAFRTVHMGYWIPLTWLSFMAEVELFGFSPGVFHLGNLVLHVAASLALLGALAALTGRWWPACAVALLFAVHPLHVESVAWIAERKDVLSTLLWMLSLWAYARYVRAPGLGRYLAVVVPFVLGLAAKPMLVTLPVTLLLLDYWPLGRLHRRAVVEKLPLFLIAAVFAALVFFTQHAGGAVKSVDQYPLASRAANALVSTVRYLGLTLWPADLAVFYPHPGSSLAPGRVTAAGLLLAATCALVVHLRRRRPALVTGWGWYLATLFPVSGLFQSGVQGMADRFAYVPSIGLLVAAAFGLGGAPPSRRLARRIAVGAASLAAAGCAVAAAAQVRLWRSDVELFTHALRSTARNDYMLMQLGAALWRKGRRREAVEHFREGLALNPASPWLHHNMGLALQREGRLAEAEGHYRRAAELKPDLAQALNNLAITLEEQGRLAEARPWYERAIGADPEEPHAHYNLGVLLYRSRDLRGAEQALERALELGPEDGDARRLLGVVALERGDVGKALGILEGAAAATPPDPEASYYLGLARLRAGDVRLAAQAFELTLRLRPDHPGARRQLAALAGR